MTPPPGRSGVVVRCWSCDGLFPVETAHWCNPPGHWLCAADLRRRIACQRMSLGLPMPWMDEEEE